MNLIYRIHDAINTINFFLIFLLLILILKDPQIYNFTVKSRYEMFIFFVAYK